MQSRWSSWHSFVGTCSITNSGRWSYPHLSAFSPSGFCSKFTWTMSINSTMLWTTCASKLCLIKNLNTNSEPSTKNWSRDTRLSNYTSSCKESRTETEKQWKKPLKWTLIANHSRSKHKIKACWNQKIHLWGRITTHHRFHNPSKIRHLLWKDLTVSLKWIHNLRGNSR